MAGTGYYRHQIPYKLFYRVHILFLVVYSLTIVHTFDIAQGSGNKARYQTYKWVIVPLLYYFCDVMMMWFNRRFTTQVTSFVSVLGHEGSKMIILRIEKPILFNYQPGQYAFLKVPSLNDMSWHPFSIASEPESNTVEFYIEVFKDGWTEKLWDKLKKNGGHRLTVELIGPYGTCLVNEPRYTNVVAIGSGTGIVPCTGLLKQHVRRMLLSKPKEYIKSRSKHMERSINILGAKEEKDGSILLRLFKLLKRMFIGVPQQEEERPSTLHRVSSTESLKMMKQRDNIRSSLNSSKLFNSELRSSMASASKSLQELRSSIASANSSTEQTLLFDLVRLNALDVKNSLAEAAASVKSLRKNVFKTMRSMCKFFKLKL